MSPSHSEHFDFLHIPYSSHCVRTKVVAHWHYALSAQSYHSGAFRMENPSVSLYGPVVWNSALSTCGIPLITTNKGYRDDLELGRFYPSWGGGAICWK